MHTETPTAEEARRSIQLTLSLPEVNAKNFGRDNIAYVMHLILQ